ncbi:MAG: FtsX-like permease family protein [Eubacteriaceae bacterium]|nr:FtsX-like permease family protein [Eubacteriaceae bacterium]
MKIGFYPKLAFTTIKNNRKLYLPYFLTCVGMITMFYIMSSLCNNPMYEYMGGGTSLNFIMFLGQRVIGIFALIFLFYTNSFLVKRRNMEFGLYNVLGMGKNKLSIITIYETLIISISSTICGLFFGILFSKLAELGLMKVVKAEATMEFRVPIDAVLFTVAVFAFIFFVILISSLIIIRRTNTLQMLNSEKLGEKPPKGNGLIALLGAIILGVAYYLAVSIKTPLAAFTVFFIAVIMVIIATYIIFTTGSVAICRILKKKKGYYYKKNHFASVSSMAFRMKRHGAGLASICILSTMVLVVMSSTVSLYIGSENSFKARYPRQISSSVKTYSVEQMKDENLDIIKSDIQSEVEKAALKIENPVEYRYAETYGAILDDKFEYSIEKLNEMNVSEYDMATALHILPVEDYRELTGKDVSLKEDETLIHCIRTKYKKDTIQIGDVRVYKVAGDAVDFDVKGSVMADVTPSIYLIVSDYSDFIHDVFKNEELNNNFSVGWTYSFDTNGDEDAQINLYSNIYDKIAQDNNDNMFHSFSVECAAGNRYDFYTTYGGLFFIGIILSGVFMLATVLIIYYKQVSEGYEDKKNFEVMQKVGMNKSDIRKSVNSQVITVFFAPLVFAILHLAFAFPLVWKILQLFNLQNLPLIIIVTVCSAVVYGLIYGVVYKITSNSYYSIVSNAN